MKEELPAWRRRWVGTQPLTALTAILIALGLTTFALPDLRENSREPVIVNAGDDAALMCIVKSLGNNTVIWKRVKYGRPEILTAGDVRVTSDTRISVINNVEKNEWLLSINSVRASDTAQYICEVNSNPAIKIFQLLQVISPSPPPSPATYPLNHNYTECCLAKDVPNNCLGFCSLQNIVLGQTGSSTEECQDHLSNVAFCMADGRDHEPCCLRENIPSACREVCRGEYTLQSASILHHYTCSHYSTATLACIAQGVEILPSPPTSIQVEPKSDREITVSWDHPKRNADTITNYVLNVTELKGFDELEGIGDEADGEMGEEEEYFPSDGTMPPTKPKIERQGRKKSFKEKYTEFKINKNETSMTLKDLKPYTMYEIYLISVNMHGTSLPTVRVRTLTLMPAKPTGKILEDNSTLPELPDIHSCCIKEGLPMEACLERFCDPTRTDEIGLTDMMICAPWVSITIPCLTQGRDHTACCRQRGLPEVCVNLCHGNVSRIDYQYFQCLPYMGVYSNCLMEGYGVLPSSPRNLVINNIHPTWSVAHWIPPEKLANTILWYNVHVRSLADLQGMYNTINNTRSPYLLDNLNPGTDYEVFITAVNKYGVSDGSPRVVFRTPKDDTATIDDTASTYNMSDCCIQSGVNSSCLPLCSYKAKLSDVKGLLPTCLDDFHKMLRCSAGGRNHVPCCQQRNVQGICMNMCAGVLAHSSAVLATSCVADLISIIECMEEGTGTLPGPVSGFQAININSTAVSLEWEAPTDSNITSYEVHYETHNAETSSINTKIVTVNITSAIIGNLTPKRTYHFYIMAVNEYGTSIPSSVIQLNLTAYNEGETINGVPTAPLALAVADKNTTSLSLIWLPPEISHPLDHLRYKLYYYAVNQTVPHTVTTTSLGVRLHDLIPNTEYIVTITAITDKGESAPGETLHAWTDPAYPAFVEVPHIHPSTNIAEGANMTVLCVAMGTPIPIVSVLVNGRLYAEERTHHMVAVIPNVTRAMDTVACFADNGYGAGMQATKRIHVSYPPIITSTESTVVQTGQTAELECKLYSYPEPRMIWWKDVPSSNSPTGSQRQEVSGERFVTRTVQQENNRFVTHLNILNVTVGDGGAYYCQAENKLGKMLQTVILNVQTPPPVEGDSIRECCYALKVAPECMDACGYDIDLEAIVKRSKCIVEINKLMFCAADGSDHRRCCLGWGVPRRCLGWCQGKAIQHGALCTLGWSRQIISCFQEGRDLLPGPPSDVVLEQVDSHSVRVSWAPPKKNPTLVQYYRVTWKKTGPEKSIKHHNDTHNAAMLISDLVAGDAYEFSIKAINHHGSSAVTDAEIIALSAEGFDGLSDAGEEAGLAVGIILALLAMIALSAFAYIWYRRKYQFKSTGGVSFENPSYMNDTVQITHTPANDNNSNGVHYPHENGWKTETIHSSEMNGSSTGVYEELHNGNPKEYF